MKTTIRMMMVVCLILSVGLIISGCSQGTQEEISDDNQEPTNQEDQMPSGDSASQDMQRTSSIRGLMSSGDSVHCTYDTEIDGQMIQQDVYISGEQYRVEVNGNFGGQQMESTMVYDGEWIYSWNTQTTQGIKFSQTFMEEQGGSSEQISIDTTETYDYNCQSWNPSGEAFDVPDDIEFMDFDAFTRDMQDMMGDASDMDIPTQ